jgi:non-specific serine/threonine protein kinase/serine/threonine-protein kinase
MNPERWQEVKRLFDAVLERDPAERHGFLESACGEDATLRSEVTALIDALADAGSRYETPIVIADPLLDRQFGPYRILRRLGTGGMGAVYLAARTDEQFRRLVAVKAIRPELLDEHTRRRFENERHTLAALEHPNIVRLLDGGTTEDGIPYLVMDYVEGQPIDRFCREHGLSIVERLDLFVPLCEAVHYAHQNLVVHRDLKPANVLVTWSASGHPGVPKLLDFGIAKLLRPEYAAGTAGLTRTSAQPMTPEYASPEQILGQPVTTASDIYALGVVLFTLLTGRHPFEDRTKSCYELERAICETDPGRPSEAAPPELVRQLRGDLDMIVLTAMRKEPQKRYASAERFAEDIRRYRRGQTVAARGDSPAYRARKFFGRHKAAVCGSALAVAALAGLAVSDDIHRRRAEQGFRDLRDLANFAINDLDKAMKVGGTAGRVQLAAKSSAYLDGLAKQAQGDDALELEVVNGYLSLADTQGNLFAGNTGQQGAAAATAAKAVALAEDLARRHPADTAIRTALQRSHEKLGDIAGSGAEPMEAMAHYRKALSVAGGDPVAKFLLLSKMAHMQEDTDVAAALESYRGCESAARDWLAHSPSDSQARRALAFAKENAGWYGLLAGEPSDAERLVVEAIAIYQETAGPKPSARTRRNLAIVYKRLAEIQKRTGKAAEALENCRRSLAASEALRAEDPSNVLYGIDVAQEKVLLIDLLLTGGDRPEARAETARAVAYLKPLAQADPPNRYYLVDYVTILAGTPFAEFASADETVAYAQKAVDLMHGADPETWDLLAQAWRRAGKLAEAIAAEQKALALLPPVKPGPVPEMRRKLTAALDALRAPAAEHRDRK